ncbi:MAG: SIMPL domain-containing protein [Pyrinomonadaceae bacterium]
MTKTILLLLAIALSASTSFAQKDVDRPLITVTGQAEIMVVPDEVAFSLSVVTMEKDLPVAQAKNDQVVKQLLALARQYHIPPTKVQTGYINVSQRFSDEDVTKKPPVFLGYTVTKSVGIILEDVSKAEDLLADIFKSGVSQIQNVSFRTSQLRKHKDQARAMAIKAAQEKAIALTKEINQSIGKAYSITEELPRTYSYSQNQTSNFVDSVENRPSSEEGTLALGQISITAQVTVSFELK